ncbi:hypothetical protein GYMLUDRAFT_248754 [Collybiopsis luxurians FD-317 M1]|uniref:Uncharacterized protein n=1 Tax=Collybiopsis luxurians FD-317 M1 TaxID=944289 RepID=A0A0D0AXI6_9AGAR|nr:hypothetical protein GYMLUDRAFT_248754 [Collybiopsis luxurians FD-317 M1]
MSEQNINMDSSPMESDQHTNSQQIPMPGHCSLPIPGPGHSMYLPPGLPHPPPHCPRLHQYIPSHPPGLPHPPSFPCVPGLPHALGLPYAPGLPPTPGFACAPGLPLPPMTHAHNREKDPAVLQENLMAKTIFAVPILNTFRCVRQKHHHQGPMLPDNSSAPFPQENAANLYQPPPSLHTITPDLQFPTLTKVTATARSKLKEGRVKDAINERSAVGKVQDEPEFQSEDDDDEIVEGSDRKMMKVKEKGKEKQETVLMKAFRTEVPLCPKPWRNWATNILNQISAQLDPAVQQQQDNEPSFMRSKGIENRLKLGFMNWNSNLSALNLVINSNIHVPVLAPTLLPTLTHTAITITVSIVCSLILTDTHTTATIPTAVIKLLL